MNVLGSIQYTLSIYSVFFEDFAYGDDRRAAECVLRWSKQQNCPNPKAFIEVINYHYEARDFRILFFVGHAQIN